MPEIIKKPAEDSVIEFIKHYHCCLNCCFPRIVDTISHTNRMFLNVWVNLLRLLFDILAIIGIVVGAGDGETFDFTQIFQDPIAGGMVAVIFFAVPIISLVCELLLEVVLEQVEKEDNPAVLRHVLYAFFWLTWVGIIAGIVLIAVLISPATIQIAAFIWGIRLFVGWLIWTPLILTILFYCRRRFGQDRDKYGKDPEPQKCPGIWCCV